MTPARYRRAFARRTTPPDEALRLLEESLSYWTPPPFERR